MVQVEVELLVVLELVVLVVVVVEQVDVVEDHLLGLACNLVLLEVLDIPDPIGIDLRLVVVEPGWVDHCSATMLNIDVSLTSSA